MDLSCNGVLRIISIIVLVFFLWTFGGLCGIAYAIKNSSEFGVQSSEFKNKKTEKPEEKFQKVLEEIEGIITDTVTDTTTKKSKLKTKKT